MESERESHHKLDLVACGVPAEGKRWSDQVTDGWVDLLRPLPVQLQVHASPQMGLGEGSWRFFMREAGAILTRRAGGAGVAGWGVMQGNEWPRCLYHMHSLWFGPSEMRDVSWAETAQELEAFGRTLQPSWKKARQPELDLAIFLTNMALLSQKS